MDVDVERALEDASATRDGQRHVSDDAPRGAGIVRIQTKRPPLAGIEVERSDSLEGAAAYAFRTDEESAAETHHTDGASKANEANGLLVEEANGGGGGFDEPDMYGGVALQDRFGEVRPGSPGLSMIAQTSIPDVNTYQQKKNLAQGMMDLALLSANANQLRYVLESSTSHPYYYPSLVLIAFSLALQVLVGIGLILNSRYDVKDEKDICKADKINNMTVLGVFLVTVVNVFIASFSVASSPTVITAP